MTIITDHTGDYKRASETGSRIRRRVYGSADAGKRNLGVESVLTSVIGKEDKLLIAANGAYGERMADIAEHAGMDYVIYNEHYDQVPKAEVIREMLKKDPSITHVAWYTVRQPPAFLMILKR